MILTSKIFLKLCFGLTLFFALLMPFLSQSQQVPTRIISLKPNITQILMQLNQEDKIVGITKFCPKPNEHAKVIADYNSVQIEEIIRLKPDLVITSSENTQQRQIVALEQLGVKVKILEFRTYDEMTDSVLEIGKWIGQSEMTKALVKKMTTQLAEIKTEALNFFGKRPRFIALVQRQPLMIAAGQTYISTLLEKAGFENVFGKNQIKYPMINPEDFMREPADYIFDLAYDTNQEPKLLGRKITVLKIDDFLATPKSVEALRELAGKL